MIRDSPPQGFEFSGLNSLLSWYEPFHDKIKVVGIINGSMTFNLNNLKVITGFSRWGVQSHDGHTRFCRHTQNIRDVQKKHVLFD